MDVADAVGRRIVSVIDTHFLVLVRLDEKVEIGREILFQRLHDRGKLIFHRDEVDVLGVLLRVRHIPDSALRICRTFVERGQRGCGW